MAHPPGGLPPFWPGSAPCKIGARAPYAPNGSPLPPPRALTPFLSPPPTPRAPSPALRTHAPRQAFDEHVNLVLGDCEETHTIDEVDAETGETIVKRNVRQLGMLFVRGDIIVHVSPPLRAA